MLLKIDLNNRAMCKNAIKVPFSVAVSTYIRTATLNYILFLHFSSGQITVGYDTDVYTSREGDGRVTLTIKVFSHPTTGAPRPFNVKVNTKNGSACTFNTSVSKLV